MNHKGERECHSHESGNPDAVPVKAGNNGSVLDSCFRRNDVGRVILFLITLMMIPSMSYAFIFTDDIGRNIEISKRPERIISLAPSITEILFYLNLGERVVGVTDFCNYPEEAKKKTSIGWIISPNVEKIISLKPDLVFVTEEGNKSDIVDILSSVNIKVYVMNPHRLEDILQEIISIGKVTGQEDIARERVDSLTSRIAEIKKMGDSNSRVRTLYLASAEPIISVGPGSFIHDIIEVSGGENVVSKSLSRYPRIEMEEIIIKNPEVIIAPPDIIETVRSWKGRWDGISAIKNNRICPIDPDIISRPGPRIIQGLEQMYRCIHEVQNAK